MARSKRPSTTFKSFPAPIKGMIGWSKITLEGTWTKPSALKKKYPHLITLENPFGVFPPGSRSARNNPRAANRAKKANDFKGAVTGRSNPWTSIFGGLRGRKREGLK